MVSAAFYYTVALRVWNPYHFHADPDQAFHFNADPDSDPVLHLTEDPDSAPHQGR
jgi:hypothetical protein